MGYKKSEADYCLNTKVFENGQIMYLLIYFDIILTGSDLDRIVVDKKRKSHFKRKSKPIFSRNTQEI